MPSWTKIARPFLSHFLFNLVKTIFGSALVGYGIARLLDPSDHLDDGGEADSDPASTNKYPNKKSRDDNKASSPRFVFEEKYVTGCVMIGAGLYFSLPSLASQMLWEAAIPAVTATEVAQGLASDSVLEYFKSWTPKDGKWKPPKLRLKDGGGGIGGGGQDR